MANKKLTPCTTCNKEIAKEAKACTHCGASYKKKHIGKHGGGVSDGSC